MTYQPVFLNPNPEASNGLNSAYSFDNFTLNEANKVAAETARQVSRNIGLSYNPLLIVGEVGLGKTHLLNAIGQAALRLNPGLKVHYMTAEGFVRDLIHGIREQRMEDFRYYYRNLDLWLVDDVDFIAGKDQTQEEFLHTFEELVQARHQIVLASRRFPQDLPTLGGELRSRFTGGVVTRLQRPDFEARLGFLEAEIKDNPLKLTGEILRRIAGTVSGPYTELAGALNSLLAYSQALEITLTPEAAEKVLQDLKFAPVEQPLSIIQN